MKILMLLPSLARGKGGTERVASELGNAMAAKGHKVAYAYKFPKSPACFPYPLPAGAPLLCFDDSRQSQIDLRDQISTLKPDVILIFYASWIISELMEIVSDLNIPILVQECSNPDRIIGVNWRNAPNAREMRSAILARATGIRLTQATYKDSIPDDLKTRVHAFPNAFTRANAYPDQDREKSILHVGGAKENKNVDDLLDAFAILAPEFPDWRLQLCTMVPPKGSKAYDALKKRLSNPLFNGKVTLSENVEDMAQYYRKASIHCITSLSEGLPNCVCEAMCQGAPSVGFKEATGVNLLIKHESNGLLAAPGPKALADQLRRLMKNEELCRKLGRQAWEDATQFEPEKAWDEWENFFQASLERSMRGEIPANEDNGKWNQPAGVTWLEKLEHEARELSGEVLFYGAGSVYEILKERFAHLKPVAMLLDADASGQESVDGIPVMAPDKVPSELKRLPVIVFGRFAPIMAHKLKSTYGFSGKIICADDNAVRDLPNKPRQFRVPFKELQTRIQAVRAGKPGYSSQKAKNPEGICDEAPACAWCGCAKTAPYLTSDNPHWFEGAKFRLVRCEKCGLVFNSPRPTEDAAVTHFNLTAEENYLRKLNRHNVQTIHDNKAKKILAFKPDARDIFDVACGAGTLMIAFRKLGLDASGNDINVFACQALREQGFTVYNEPTLKLPLENCFDIITMMDYLEHTYTPFDDLLKAWLMLRPGGILHLKTLYLGSPDHAAHGEKWRLFGKGHNYYFLPVTLEAMVENAGFQILKSQTEQLIHITALKPAINF